LLLFLLDIAIRRLDIRFRRLKLVKENIKKKGKEQNNNEVIVKNDKFKKQVKIDKTEKFEKVKETEKIKKTEDDVLNTSRLLNAKNKRKK